MVSAALAVATGIALFVMPITTDLALSCD